MKVTNNSYRQLQLGNNDFQSVLISGTGVVKAGTILAYASGKYSVATAEDLEKPLAVCVNDVTASSAGVADRVLISGRVDGALCFLGETAATDAALNALRKNSIIPVTVKQVGQLDNQ